MDNRIYLIITILFNIVIGVDNDSIEDLDITPVNSTFSIWSLIYSSLYITLSIEKKWSDRQTTLFLISCLANVSWLYFWSKNEIEIANISLFILPLALIQLWNDLLKKKSEKDKITNDDYITLNSIGLYTGWTIGAFLLNSFYVIKKRDLLENKNINNLAITLFSLTQIIWQILGVMKKKNKKKFFRGSLAIPLVGLWTSYGIYRNKKMKNLSSRYLVSSILALINHGINI